MRAAMVVGAILLLGACHTGSEEHEGQSGGGSGRRAYQVDNFDRVRLAGAHNVVVTVGGPAAVRAEGDPRTLDRLDIRVENGSLEIGSRERWSFGRHEGKPVTVFVTVPSLRGASIDGSGDLRVDRVEGADFSGSIGGSGNLDIGAMKVARANFAIAGSGGIRATGTAEETEISVAGSGDVAVDALETKRGKVSVMGSGDVRLRASEAADVSVMGSGDVTVSGTARCSVSKMGSGDVRCAGTA
jgi:hypothetical protein